MSDNELILSIPEVENVPSIYPTFVEYFNSIHEFITKKDNSFYIKFKWLSPMKVQIEDIYFIKVDEDVKYLSKFKGSKHFYYSTKEIGINGTSGNRPIFYEVIKTEQKYELKPLKKLPLEIF